ncbi:hypothetical protein [Xanthomonas citri]|uniref:hypothetical protein n=1 Tax=Xanthomonas citri TaxID=346 RepID=UPI0002E6653B|nr:hypothetical protein [Xanthomonas citri]AMV00303.1 hypothetical protein TP37_21095 [Xanthomonas citri pv. aurantifolii]MCC8491354.1 hypothetical protein [Xanthomonas citri pv. fuscans]TBW97619.1 hypothetical protein TP47_10730 [Xanthomonas citri pv. aurantifolii]TBX04210.1 hypothetical protein TP46_06655 [Xanthomonas citri pv. aurantifolii]
MSEPFRNDAEYQIHETALGLVRMERTRQVLGKGYDVAHDDQHGADQLATAAGYYLLPLWHNQDVCVITTDGGLMVQPMLDLIADTTFDGLWRTDSEDDPSTEAIERRIETVVKGCALGVAELERLLRLRAAAKGAR